MESLHTVRKKLSTLTVRLNTHSQITWQPGKREPMPLEETASKGGLSALYFFKVKTLSCEK